MATQHTTSCCSARRTDCCTMEDGKGKVGMDPDMDDDSDDEVSLLVVDEDELNTTLNEAGIQVKVSCCMTQVALIVHHLGNVPLSLSS